VDPVIGNASADLWAEAYVKVESYFAALRIRNKLLLSRLVFHVLDRASRRFDREGDEGKSPTQLAAEEVNRVVDDWLRQVLDEPAPEGDAAPHLSARGRLALVLAEMPSRWQSYFLADAPWPEEFVRMMRQTYLRAGPDFQISQMQPRQLHLGPVSTAAKKLESLERYPKVKTIVVWVFTMLMVMVVTWLLRR